MIKLFCLGMKFLKNSRMLTVTLFLSIFLACFLSISMSQLSFCAENSYKNSVHVENDDNVYVENDEREEKLLFIFQTLLRVLFVIVICISALLIVSVFKEYMRKYLHDMAIIRTIGGKNTQIVCIFAAMSFVVSLCGCMAGVLVSVLFNDFFLTYLNNRIHIFSVSVVMDWRTLLVVTAVVFVFFNVFVIMYFSIRQRVLPIQLLIRRPLGARRNRKNFLFLRRFVGVENYLGMKLLIPKCGQNFLIIMIITLITALSYIGQGTMQLLLENQHYIWRDEMQDGDARAEWQFDSWEDSMLSRTEQVSKQLNEGTLECQMLLGRFEQYLRSMDGGEITGFFVTDICSFMKRFRGRRMGCWEDIPVDQRLIMTEDTAKDTGYKLGDTITLDTDWLNGSKEFTVVEIVTLDQLQSSYMRSSVIIETGNISCLDVSGKEWVAPTEAVFYIKGGEKKLDSLLKLISQKNSGFTYEIYEQIAAEAEMIQTQRIVMIKLILFFLMLIAGLGWVNSARGMLIAGKQDYQVLRLLGSPKKQVRKIIWIQVIGYMLAGILLGLGLGSVCVYLLCCSVVDENMAIPLYWRNIVWIAFYLCSLSLMLITTIKKLADLQ